MEGLIYTTVPLVYQFRGYLEIVTQVVLLSALLSYWVNHPGKKWLNWLLSIAFCLVIALSTMGLLMPQR
jgi:hypothetical protein